uniref:Unique cartilage matrix-associated protein n=1 Tax=Poecilia mexicana TaxID=48701 RepID=A0A3B3YUK3_9TELE
MTPNLQMLKVMSAQPLPSTAPHFLCEFKLPVLSSPGAARQVFMAESDASNFFSQKRRSRRSPKSYAEVQAEQRMKRAASERRREYNEEQRDEYENYLEEDRDEVNERSRETNEQLREYHYDGLYPRFYWFH